MCAVGVLYTVALLLTTLFCDSKRSPPNAGQTHLVQFTLAVQVASVSSLFKSKHKAYLWFYWKIMTHYSAILATVHPRIIIRNYSIAFHADWILSFLWQTWSLFLSPLSFLGPKSLRLLLVIRDKIMNSLRRNGIISDYKPRIRGIWVT